MIKIPKECQKQDLTVTPSKRGLSSPPTQHNGTRIVMNSKFHFKFHFISIELVFGCGTKVNVQYCLEPSIGILHRYHLTRGSMLTSQDYNPSSVVYVPEPIRAI